MTGRVEPPKTTAHVIARFRILATIVHLYSFRTTVLGCNEERSNCLSQKDEVQD